MSDLYKAIPSEEVDLMHAYLRNYSEGKPISRDNMSYFLRFWNDAKLNLYRMFDNKLILKREVKFEKGLGELKLEMEDMVRCHPFIEDFHSAVRRIYDVNTRFALSDIAYDMTDLVENIYRGTTFSVASEFVPTGKEFKIDNGCKLLKMLGKFATAFGIEEYFEDFRQKHSQILNQKKVIGTLCLSIHPFDYITMSDNASGWSSCMAWMDDPGDYRLGTIEMMNSPYVVVAYLEGADQMWVPEGKWNNKRWRQLYIVTPEMILGNRQYPYENDELQGLILNWLRDMASTIPGYGPYEELASNIVNHEINTFGERNIRIVLNMNYMYNDIYGQRLGYFSKTYDNPSYYLGLSGEAVCTGCGEVIELESVEANSVRCCDCDGTWRCWYCGDLYSGEKYWVDGNPVCEWCYENEIERCDHCGTVVADTYGLALSLIPISDFALEKKMCQVFNGRYSYRVCQDCYDNKTEFPDLGKVITLETSYGVPYKALDLTQVTEDGLEEFDIPTYIKESLWDLRNAKTYEERVKILREKFHIDFS